MSPSTVGNGVQADHLIEQANRGKRCFDAVVLDLTLPGMDGMDLLKSMRRRKDFTPVLVLTARATLSDRVTGLESGADDYLSKPFETQELLARLRVIARRQSQSADGGQEAVGNLSYDPATRVFTVSGATLVLPPRIHVMLEALFKKRGKPVTKDHFMNMDEEGMSMEAIDTQMYRLRKRLRDAGADVVISTHKGVGFMMSLGDDDSPAA